MTLSIKGVPYSLSWVPPGPCGRHGGWSVIANQQPTDHLHRNYFVRANEEGKPVCCTCPAFVYSDPHDCKHVRAVAELVSNHKEI
jgi:hypothetical protein